ncbi:putative alkane-1-monooxygenase [Actinoplanes missouriensis 431]|uniref:Putative alkane-1-monooxygenase n=1 Tax=Actinoplanes missouriensis (strain ATCC 14538 / DSM 43046 / CBS 188.64 / JCM 3121 / NBRC 102363 / NCIMB 12654 / NRRL B-3342 / UNCC 431) TaxID=512565 RepID=I0H4Z4_ACTM4|nr:alkane 1-monooxygenase [Actinoplanes missouriensis]BAL88081.1 putative alkane-1-monooxygenase [Actinoplanes missouriensis 431]
MTAALAWRDTKRPLWPLALVVPTLPFAALAITLATGSAWGWWLTPVFILGVIPLIDVLVGDDRDNPPDTAVPALLASRYYRWITYVFVPVQYAALVMACAVWSHGIGALGAAGLVLTAGLVNGIAINTAHELGHKRESVERWLSKIALAPTGYGHFFVEHNRGHHVRVATPEDPASARLGESYWRFWPRTVAGGLRSAWNLETNRHRLRQRSPWSRHNDVLNAWAMTVALFTVLCVAFGPGVLAFLILQGIVGFSVLEAVNYLEHYGLLRQRNAAGRYEKVDPRHSWNSDRLTTNVFLFQLQRHSDHHANPLRRYQTLRTFDVSPQLPAGYATMLLLALIPPLWRRVMDHRVLRHYGGEAGRANAVAGYRPAREHHPA